MYNKCIIREKIYYIEATLNYMRLIMRLINRLVQDTSISVSCDLSHLEVATLLSAAGSHSHSHSHS